MDAVTIDNPDWRRLGDYATRRREQLGMTQADVAAADGPSVATLRKIEKGAAPEGNYRGVVLVSLERVLKWPDGAVDRILAGGEPGTDAPTPPKRTGLTGQQLVDYEEKLIHIRDNPNRSPALQAWARTLLDKIADELDSIYAADQAEENQRHAS